VHPDDSEKMEAFFVKVRDTQYRQESPDFRLKDIHGHWHWFDTNVTPIWNSKGETVGYTGTAREITDKKLMEESLHLEKEIFKTTLMSVGDGIIATDVHGRVTIMNQVAEELTGWTQKEAMGRKLELILSLRKDKTLEDIGNLALEVIREERVLMLQDLLITTRNGLLVPIEESAAPIRDSSGEITGAVIVFWDITDKREKQKQVEYLSFHDHLTGLYNRRYMEMIIRRMDEAQIRPLALMVIDVNGLKLTNDAFGHDMGDLLLKKVAEIITTCVREEDVVCRVGGDEFVLVLPHTTEEEAECLRSRIKKLAMESSMESVMISLAMGYAVKTEPEQELTVIQKLADNNMYKNKLKKGRIMRSRTIETVLRNINSKYDYEQIHTERVSQFCERIALALGLPPKDVEDAKISGSLHDIGKIMISPETLNKTEGLTDREWEEVRKHPMTGYQILRGVDEYSSLAKVILHHHERMDGKGYPDHLVGEEIPLLSRIITVADAFEAMTASRSYQKTKTLEEAIVELKRCRGTQFDPRIVDAFVEQVLKAGE
jgi:diguanylate cyclase (GGDEF)-like protein/PAS domain S-box-containing protein